METEERNIVLAVIDMLSASRHAFKSKQIERARRLLEGLVNQTDGQTANGGSHEANHHTTGL